MTILHLQNENYNGIAKTMFITNLPFNLYTIIRIKNPNSLKDVLNSVLEEEEFQNFIRVHNSSQKQFCQHQNHSNPPSKTN